MVREEGLSSESGEGVGEGDWRMEREKIDQRSQRGEEHEGESRREKITPA